MPSRKDGNHGQPQFPNGIVSTSYNVDVNPYTESPYKDPELILIDVGPKPVRYYVHRTVLSQSKVLFAKINPSFWQSKANIITLPDLDESTAHTLVHYLYSGGYQMLKRHSSIRRSKEMMYQSSVLVYCTALHYELSGLADLAREKIRYLGERVPILDILITSREHAFPNLPQDDSWFSTYLHNTIELAVKTNPKLFTESSFSDQIEGNRTFRHVVVKAIVACQTSRATELEDHGKAVSTLTIGAGDEDEIDMPNDTTLHDTYEDPPMPPESKSSQPAPSQLAQEAEASSGEKLEPAMKPELTMEFEENLAEDRDGSAFRFGHKAKKSKKKSSAALIEDSVPESAFTIEPEKVKEDDPWSISFGAGTAKDKKEEGGAIVEEASPEPEHQAPQPDIEPEKEEDAWEWGTTASGKKKKKKKGRAVTEEVKGKPVIEEPPPLELAPPPLAEDD
ncbi:hypothetical protein GRF29_8g2487650 [Pseudopithomyces chartarum]|uniref:BTB domain-containing protein n=1 Tax=Pseudopithomyces chartarum TaxID=1892770 RepID=A0AAN6M4H5_9PLEO|nr:hypothetical protein GRF29_8g2487650 [Pseudopithomyces chartarum]